MAVSLLSQFYAGGIWQNISRIVFTSPNLPSPSSAGTRSNVVPSEIPLALWYEGAASMYRVAESQETPSGTNYYNIYPEYVIATEVDLSNIGTYAPITPTLSGYLGQYFVADCTGSISDYLTLKRIHGTNYTTSLIDTSSCITNISNGISSISGTIDLFSSEYYEVGITTTGTVSTSLSGLAWYYIDCCPDYNGNSDNEYLYTKTIDVPTIATTITTKTVSNGWVGKSYDLSGVNIDIQFTTPTRIVKFNYSPYYVNEITNKAYTYDLEDSAFNTTWSGTTTTISDTNFLANISYNNEWSSNSNIYYSNIDSVVVSGCDQGCIVNICYGLSPDIYALSESYEANYGIDSISVSVSNDGNSWFPLVSNVTPISNSIVFNHDSFYNYYRFILHKTTNSLLLNMSNTQQVVPVDLVEETIITAIGKNSENIIATFNTYPAINTTNIVSYSGTEYVDNWYIIKECPCYECNNGFTYSYSYCDRVEFNYTKVLNRQEQSNTGWLTSFDENECYIKLDFITPTALVEISFDPVIKNITTICSGIYTTLAQPWTNVSGNIQIDDFDATIYYEDTWGVLSNGNYGVDINSIVTTSSGCDSPYIWHSQGFDKNILSKTNNTNTTYNVNSIVITGYLSNIATILYTGMFNGVVNFNSSGILYDSYKVDFVSSNHFNNISINSNSSLSKISKVISPSNVITCSSGIVIFLSIDGLFTLISPSTTDYDSYLASIENIGLSIDSVITTNLSTISGSSATIGILDSSDLPSNPTLLNNYINDFYYRELNKSYISKLYDNIDSSVLRIVNAGAIYTSVWQSISLFQLLTYFYFNNPSSSYNIAIVIKNIDTSINTISDMTITYSYLYKNNELSSNFKEVALKDSIILIDNGNAYYDASSIIDNNNSIDFSHSTTTTGSVIDMIPFYTNFLSSSNSNNYTFGNINIVDVESEYTSLYEVSESLSTGLAITSVSGITPYITIQLDSPTIINKISFDSISYSIDKSLTYTINNVNSLNELSFVFSDSNNRGDIVATIELDNDFMVNTNTDIDKYICTVTGISNYFCSNSDYSNINTINYDIDTCIGLPLIKTSTNNSSINYSITSIIVEGYNDLNNIKTLYSGSFNESVLFMNESAFNYYRIYLNSGSYSTISYGELDISNNITNIEYSTSDFYSFTTLVSGNSYSIGPATDALTLSTTTLDINNKKLFLIDDYFYKNKTVISTYSGIENLDIDSNISFDYCTTSGIDSFSYQSYNSNTQSYETHHVDITLTPGYLTNSDYTCSIPFNSTTSNETTKNREIGWSYDNAKVLYITLNFDTATIINSISFDTISYSYNNIKTINYISPNVTWSGTSITIPGISLESNDTSSETVPTPAANIMLSNSLIFSETLNRWYTDIDGFSLDYTNAYQNFSQQYSNICHGANNTDIIITDVNELYGADGVQIHASTDGISWNNINSSGNIAPYKFYKLCFYIDSSKYHNSSYTSIGVRNLKVFGSTPIYYGGISNFKAYYDTDLNSEYAFGVNNLQFKKYKSTVDNEMGISNIKLYDYAMDTYNGTTRSGIVITDDNKVYNIKSSNITMINDEPNMKIDSLTPVTVTGTVIDINSPIYSLNTTKQYPLNINENVVFSISSGECYNCRLTAWPDASHGVATPISASELLQNGLCRANASAFYLTGTTITGSLNNSNTNYIFAPENNIILQGNTSYYGDFTMEARQLTNQHGDYLMFKPFIVDADTLSVGSHNFIIAFHYSYT